MRDVGIALGALYKGRGVAGKTTKPAPANRILLVVSAQPACNPNQQLNH